VVYRQFRGGTLTMRGLALMPGILLVAGAYLTFEALPGASGTEIDLLVADLAVLSLLGALRGMSTRLSTQDGYAFQKGTPLTLVLWLATIGARIGFVVLGGHLGAVGPLMSASVALTLGLSIGIQNAVAYLRAHRMGLRIAANKDEAARVSKSLCSTNTARGSRSQWPQATVCWACGRGSNCSTGNSTAGRWRTDGGYS
jgi:hypothetical protein